MGVWERRRRLEEVKRIVLLLPILHLLVRAEQSSNMQFSSLFFVLVLLSLGNKSHTDIWDDDIIDDSGTYFDDDRGKKEAKLDTEKFEEEEEDSEGSSYEDYYNNDDEMEV